MLKLIFVQISMLIILNAQPSLASVWSSENQWNAEWENKYSSWVENHWTKDIFMQKDSLVYGIETDCADATYTMRMLFSFENKLPFKINNPIGGAHYITSDTTQFDSIIEPLARFHAFVNYINEITDSASLSNDTYPIAISNEALRPGTVYVSPNSHTYQIKKMNQNGIPVIYSSTIPKKNQNLSEVHSFPFYIPKDFKKFRDGFRAFKQPQFYGKSQSLLPHYSLEQFEISKQFGEDILAFGDALAKKLEKRPETLDEKLQRSSQNLCNFVQSRAIHINNTFKLRQNKNIECFNSTDYENESTPNRDLRIKMIYDYMKTLTLHPEFHQSLSPYYPTVKSIFNGSNLDDFSTLNWCSINKYTLVSQIINLKTVYWAINSNKLISDPNASLDARWGLEEHTPTCPQY